MEEIKTKPNLRTKKYKQRLSETYILKDCYIEKELEPFWNHLKATTGIRVFINTALRNARDAKVGSSE